MRHLFALVGVGVVMLCVSTNANAQMGLRPKVTTPKAQRSYSAPSQNNVTAMNRAYTRKPSVSPYLNLLNGGDPNLTNYQSMVRPMVNQNRVNAQQNAQINRLEAKPPTSGNAGSESMRSTGHQATYRNYSHFYPNLR